MRVEARKGDLVVVLDIDDEESEEILENLEDDGFVIVDQEDPDDGYITPRLGTIKSRSAERLSRDNGLGTRRVIREKKHAREHKYRDREYPLQEGDGFTIREEFGDEPWDAV